MQVVNWVYRGALQETLNLTKISKSIQHSDVRAIKHQQTQPEQLLIKFFNGNTMIIFKSGCFRMMGKDDSVASHLNIFEIICQFSSKIPNVKIQTMTACYNYGRKILIANMSNCKDVIVTAEHFPEVQVKKFAPIHIKNFSSGKVT